MLCICSWKSVDNTPRFWLLLSTSPTSPWLFLQSATTQPQNLLLGKRGIAKTAVLNWSKGYPMPFNHTILRKGTSRTSPKEDERGIFKRADKKRMKVPTEASRGKGDCKEAQTEVLGMIWVQLHSVWFCTCSLFDTVRPCTPFLMVLPELNFLLLMMFEHAELLCTQNNPNLWDKTCGKGAYQLTKKWNFSFLTFENSFWVIFSNQVWSLSTELFMQFLCTPDTVFIPSLEVDF